MALGIRIAVSRPQVLIDMIEGSPTALDTSSWLGPLPKERPDRNRQRGPQPESDLG